MYNTQAPSVTDVIPRLGERLRNAGYREEGIQEVLGAKASSDRQFGHAVYLRRVTGSDARSVLVRLFYLMVGVSEPEAASALRPVSLKSLEEANVVRFERGQVLSNIAIVARAGLLFAGDTASQCRPTHDHVTPFSDSTAYLAALMMHENVTSVLDLGCGSGALALLAAPNAVRVVASDLNRRALAFTAFNASLNDVRNVEVTEGNWLEGLGEQRFDLILCNPPFVVSPDQSLLFRDNPLPGDDLCKSLIQTIPGFLTSGGCAQILCNWTHGAGQQWWEPIRPWLEPINCDTWVLHFRTDDPITYAAQWNDELLYKDPTEFEDRLNRWLSYYQQAGIEAISFGAVVLRNPANGPAWTRMASASIDLSQTAGKHVRRLLTTPIGLTALDENEQLLEKHVRLAERHRIEQRLVFDGGGYGIEQPIVKSTSGLGFEIPIDVTTLQALLRLDVAHPLKSILQRASQELGLTLEELYEKVLPDFRQLLEVGLLSLDEGDDS